MTRAQESAILDRGIELIEKVAGRRPTGYVAPLVGVLAGDRRAAFTMTIHPDVSGRPQTLLMLERLIEYISGHEGVRWSTFDEIATDFKARSPRA